MSTDPFSDVLLVAQAQTVISGRLVAGGTWAFRFRSHHKLKFYAVTDGGCWLRAAGERKPRRLEKGDVLLLSGDSAFVLSDGPTTPPRDACPVFESGGTSAKVGTAEDCAVLTGVVSLHPSSAARFTSALPSLIHVRADTKEATSLRWMIERIDEERRAALPGARVLSAQLAQAVFILVLRTHVSGAAALPPGWLRAVRDETLLGALREIHGQPGRAWTLAELAKAAGMSRARFAARFKSAAGIAPLAYLTEWRMHLAQKRLRDEPSPIIEIATSLGYGSESAFSHAFKRVTGTGPRAYRAAEAQCH